MEPNFVKIGYARASTVEQNLDIQIHALKEAGAERIFKDQGVSGAAVIKPGYIEALSFARPGDEIIVWRLDRLSRSLRDLIDDLQKLGDMNLMFRSITEKIETATPAGRLLFQVIGALAEFERDTIRARAEEGNAAAHTTGKKLGRPPSISDAQWTTIKGLLNGSPPLSLAKAGKMIGISRQAVHQRLQKENASSRSLPLLSD